MTKLLAALLVASSPALASDHIDGPVTTKHRVADLSDFYAFPTPGKHGSLTLVLNTYPLVHKDGHFSDKVAYTFHARRAAIKGTGDRAFFETGDEQSITCTFVTPRAHHNHTANCKSSNGLAASAPYGEVLEQADGDFRLFAGMRSDTFFFNSDFATQATKGKLLPPKDKDVMSGTNILSIVLEIEVARLFKNGAPSMLALAVEATTQDGTATRRLDRLGRPEVTNVTMAEIGGVDLRDQYNTDRPFEVNAANQKSYVEKISSNIAFYDKLDKKNDWKDADRDSFSVLFADDFLVVDLSKPCAGDNFLEIEKAMLTHKAHATCGGRKLGDDIMDTLFTAYIAGLGGARIRDGVDKPSVAVTDKFPYLAEPDLSVGARAKAFLARKLLGIPD